MENSLLIYGAGGFAREVAWLASETNPGIDLFTPAAFIDDSGGSERALDGLVVLGLATAIQRFGNLSYVIGIGDPRIREQVADNAAGAGLTAAILIHESVRYSRRVKVAPGAIICAGSTLTTNIEIGAHVHINLHCTVGHDVRIGDFVTLSPGVHVSGNVHIERGAYIGTGAVISNGTSDQPIVIGKGAVIGAGAVVLKSVPAHATAVGVPAKQIR